MAIRAFITTWSVEDLPEGRQVHNPIVDYIGANVTDPVQCSMHYPDADVDGLPDKSKVLILVRSNVVPTSQIEQLINIAGVKYMLPAYRFNKPISEIPTAVKDDVKNKIVVEGIPLGALAGVVVYGDFLKKVAKYFSVNHKGFGNHIEVDADTDFE